MGADNKSGGNKAEGKSVAISSGHAELRLAVVGPFSSGKSALINALVGEAVAPMGVTPVGGAAPLSLGQGAPHRGGDHRRRGEVGGT